MAEELLVFNGINGDTGSYDLPPMAAEDLVRLIRGEPLPENLNELRFRVQQATTGHLGIKEGLDPTNLAEAGWGVILPQYGTSEPDRDMKVQQVAAIREALQPLLQLREQETGGRFSEWVQGTDKGYRVGAGVDSKSDYLARHGVGPGPANPDKVPYYLLIVGGPDEIPYRFQSQLDVQYAVGRIHFDTVDEYAAYAANVVAAANSSRLARQAAFFGVANPDDSATQMSYTKLVEPLTGYTRENYSDWDVQMYGPDQASKATLTSLLGGDRTPSLLFTASHGMKFDPASSRQLRHQGALLCQNWPGPEQWSRQPIPQDYYFAGDDLTTSVDLLGLMAFFFACYGGGTPQFSEFARQDSPSATTPRRQEIAPQPFLAKLPQAMLGRSRGALAVVGHVERAWSYSFDWGRAGAQTTVFESTMKRLLDGHPIGSALEYFDERYAELSTVLSDELEEIDFGKRYNPFELAGMWTANNDARGYAIIGDPAVRLPVARGNEEAVSRDLIEVQPLPAISVKTVDAADSVPQAEQATTDEATPQAPVSMSFASASPSTEVRTYVSSNLEAPSPDELKAVTRRAADGAIETVISPDLAGGESQVLSLHQSLAERLMGK